MEWLDRAAQQEQAERDHAIRMARELTEKNDVPGLSHCKDCGDGIPEKRQLIRGVTRCVPCQEVYELDTKRGL